jgi:hypothetical protein
MLNKTTAIARLRATGTLGSEETMVNVIPAAGAKEPLARVVSNLLLSNRRMIAPAANQSVLP